MNYKHYSVIDKNGYYKTYVLAHLEEDGSTIKSIETYNMKNGDQLLDVLSPDTKFVRAKWNGMEWVETATPEEIEARRQQQLM